MVINVVQHPGTCVKWEGVIRDPAYFILACTPHIERGCCKGSAVGATRQRDRRPCTNCRAPRLRLHKKNPNKKADCKV
jgi:hypothetical protein